MRLPAAALVALMLAASAVPTGAAAPPQEFPPEAVRALRGACDPGRIRSLLARADSCEVGKACGRLDRPWLYRGGQRQAPVLHVHGTRLLGPAWTTAFAQQLLQGVAIDSTTRVGPLDVDCAPPDSAPVYLCSFFHGESMVRALLRFDTGQVLFFTDREGLGSARMSEGDSLWGRLADALEWDAHLVGPRPVPHPDTLPPASVWDGGPREDELPVALEKLPPVYPEEAVAKGISGTVTVEVLISESGGVRDACVLSGPRALYDAALEAVWAWRFQPARSHGRACTVWTMVPVKFTLH